MISLQELTTLTLYRGEGRNFNVALWTGTVFIGPRYKWGEDYLDSEHYYGPAQGTFQPMEEIDNSDELLDGLVLKESELNSGFILNSEMNDKLLKLLIKLEGDKNG